MIRVTIEMVPGGIDELAKHMATIEIANDVKETLRSDGKKGNYYARISRISQHGEHLGWYDRVAHVKGINRNRSGAVYRILHGVLADFLEEKQKGCCTSCDGTGYSGDSAVPGGKCWDCRGTGHAHTAEDPCEEK